MQKAIWVGDKIMPYDECLAAIKDAREAINDVAKDKKVDITAVIDKESYTVVTQYRHKSYGKTAKEHLAEDIVSIARLVEAISNRYGADPQDIIELVRLAFEDEDYEE